MKSVSHFTFEVEGCVYNVTIRFHHIQTKEYTADWVCAANGKRGQLDYPLADCYSVESAARKEIQRQHDKP
jgi:hypothetical protein